MRIIHFSFQDASQQSCSLRLVAQDTALSRREQGFETPRERHFFLFDSQKLVFQPIAYHVDALAALRYKLPVITES